MNLKQSSSLLFFVPCCAVSLYFLPERCGPNSMTLLTIPAHLIASYNGDQVAKIMSTILAVLFLWEWLITLDVEVEYFWSCKWGTSQVLFLINRYLPACVLVLDLLAFMSPDPSNDFCRDIIRLSFVLHIVAISIIQAMLVLRVCYLFSYSKPVQGITILCFLASVVTSSYFLYHATKDLQIISANSSVSIPQVISKLDFHVTGCQAARPTRYWRIFLPSLILHTLLYVLTAFRALKNRQFLKDAPILKRLLRDGGLFLAIVFICVTLTMIGAFSSVPTLNIPAIYSPFMLVFTSISISRVMFSIQSLAAKLGSNEAWIFNSLELNRVGWKRGSREGELIVEKNMDEDNIEEVPETAHFLRMTKVGMEDSGLPTSWRH